MSDEMSERSITTEDFAADDDASISTHDIARSRARMMHQDLFIKHGRRSFRIQADVHDSVGTIKKELEELTGVPTDQQVLAFNGAGLKFDDDKSLKYYGCSAGGFFILTEKKKRAGN